VTYPTRHRQEEPLREPASTSDAVAELLDNLAEVRARRRSPERPFVTLAYAQSLDGSITTARGRRYTLSGPEAMRFTHTLRAGHHAILVGVGTVLADDPQLGVRLVDGPSPQPVVVDTRLRTPLEAKLFSRPGRRIWLATAAVGEAGVRRRRARVQRLEAQGCRIVDCPALPNGWVDLQALLRRLAGEGIEHVMVEGGARIITSFLEARLVDYAIVTLAPQFLGGLPALGRETRSGIVSAVANLQTWVSGRLGDDLVLGGEVAWPEP
jgi:3,4-dihydroxy 2-butanone 4-phosphate synthase/GTP cyclohydrolase II